MKNKGYTNVTQPAFSGGIISTELFGRLDFDKIKNGLKRCDNWVVRPSGGVIYRAGTKYVAECKTSTGDVRLIPFTYNNMDALCLEFTDKCIRFYKNGTTVKNGSGKPYEITTPYLDEEIKDVKYIQNLNKLYLVHPNHPPAVLERTTDNSWSYKVLLFNPTNPLPVEVTIKADTAKESGTVVNYDKWQYAVSSVDKDDHEGMAVKSNVITSDIDLTNQPITVSFKKPSSVTNIDHYNIYRIKNGDFCLVYKIDETEQAQYSIKDISFSVDESKCIKEPFEEFNEGNYPSAVGFWNQRLLLGGTKKKPNTFWGSRVGEPEDFTTTVLQGDDEGFELTFNSSTMNGITDFVTMDDLIVFTYGNIWRVQGSAVSNMTARIESYVGSSGLSPFTTKKSILFIDSSINTVSDFVYSEELNGYSGQNLDVLSRELMEGYRLEDISYKANPYGVLYVVRSDGALLGLTYMREQNIYAWHKHTTTDGYFRAVCALKKAGNDDVYFVVERDGKKYIEILGGYINQNQGVESSWHLDSAVRYSSDLYEWSAEKVSGESITYKAYEVVNTGDVNFYCFRAYHKKNHSGQRWYYYCRTTAWDPNNKYTSTTNPHGPAAANATKESFYKTGYGYTNAAYDYARDWGGGQPKQYDRKFPFTYTHRYVYILNTKQGETVYYSDGGTLKKYSTVTSYSGDTIKVGDLTYRRSTASDIVKTTTTSETVYLYTEGNPTVGGYAYDTPDKATAYVVTDTDGVTMTVDGLVYSGSRVAGNIISSVDGLERFEGRYVTALIDGNVYKDLLVLNGHIDLPIEGANVLVGMGYKGVLELIPYDTISSNNESTMGMNRKNNDGLLYYSRTRGLSYGKDEDHLFEIKPYTDSTFSEEIPLETNKITLKVSSGFSQEDTFVAVQDNPLPALIQSITLGITYYGKN